MENDDRIFGNFLVEFFRRPGVIGAIHPSSRHLARRMIQPINFETAQTIVEFGPGTGVFTRYILDRKRPDTSFFALELNDSMYRVMLDRFPHVAVYHDSAARIKDYLSKHQQTGVDAVVSGLPWAAFTDSLQDEILTPTLEALHPGGFFSSFAYLQGLLLPAGLRFRKKLHSYFSQVRISPVTWRNLPPAFVYWCTK